MLLMSCVLVLLPSKFLLGYNSISLYKYLHTCSATIEIFARPQRMAREFSKAFCSATIEIFARLQLY